MEQEEERGVCSGVTQKPQFRSENGGRLFKRNTKRKAKKKIFGFNPLKNKLNRNFRTQVPLTYKRAQVLQVNDS